MGHDDRRWNIKDLRSAGDGLSMIPEEKEIILSRTSASSAGNGVEGASDFKGASGL